MHVGAGGSASVSQGTGAARKGVRVDGALQAGAVRYPEGEQGGDCQPGHAGLLLPAEPDLVLYGLETLLQHVTQQRTPC